MTKKMYQPFYWGDYLRDTQQLSLEEHGAYILLICEYWNKGKPLPSDETKIFRILRCATDAERNAARIILAEYFTLDGTVYIHERIQSDLQIHSEKAEKASLAASKAAKARWGSDAQGNAARNAQGNASAMPTKPNHIKDKKTKAKKGKQNGTNGKRLKNYLGESTIIPSEWANWSSTELNWPQERIDSVWPRFYDYWLGIAGDKGVKADWLATWRNWCRRDFGTSTNRNNNIGGIDPAVSKAAASRIHRQQQRMADESNRNEPDPTGGAF